jgi:undecaprenyl-diphosphatase
VTLGAIGGFLAISRVIGGKTGSGFDRSVVRATGGVRRPIVDSVARAITFFGGVPGAVGVSLGSLLFTRKRPRLLWQIAIGSLGGVSAELYFKRLFLRKRPTLLSHLEDVASTSFPSGHAMAASSLYLTLAFVASHEPRLRAHRAALLASAFVSAAAIGATRVYLGVHWPTDVLGGLTLGTAWACATEGAFSLVSPERHRRLPPMSMRPSTPA